MPSEMLLLLPTTSSEGVSVTFSEGVTVELVDAGGCSGVEEFDVARAA